MIQTQGGSGVKKKSEGQRNGVAFRYKQGMHRGAKSRSLYAALDLGTNNCRLLIAKPEGNSFQVVDAFSRIVRLGEGLAHSGELSDAAQSRAIEALKVCQEKILKKNVSRLGLIATEACRAAKNGAAFITRVQEETGIKLSIIDRKREAKLAALGCSPLADPEAKGIILFDIGGGSSELVWLSCEHLEKGPPRVQIHAWASLPIGVVTMAERFGGKDVTPALFGEMIAETERLISRYATRMPRGDALAGMHLLGTSGTVTTLAGLHLGLPRYDRKQVDGIWLDMPHLETVTQNILSLTYDERVSNNCIGLERADLVLAGCAILKGIHNNFPLPRLRVADRGLREGILYELMRADRIWSEGVKHGR